MGTSAAPWAHRVLSPCSYRFNTPSIISPLLILPGRALSRMRARARACSVTFTASALFPVARPSPFFVGREEWRRSRIRAWFFLQTRTLLLFAGERWRQLKPRRNFLRIAVRRRRRGGGPRARARASCSPFCYCYRALGAGAVRAATFIHVTGGAMPAAVSAEEKYIVDKINAACSK